MLGSRILVVGGDSEAGKVIEVAPALNAQDLSLLLSLIQYYEETIDRQAPRPPTLPKLPPLSKSYLFLREPLSLKVVQ